MWAQNRRRPLAPLAPHSRYSHNRAEARPLGNQAMSGLVGNGFTARRRQDHRVPMGLAMGRDWATGFFAYELGEPK